MLVHRPFLGGSTGSDGVGMAAGRSLVELGWTRVALQPVVLSSKPQPRQGTVGAPPSHVPEAEVRERDGVELRRSRVVGSLGG